MTVIQLWGAAFLTVAALNLTFDALRRWRRDRRRAAARARRVQARRSRLRQHARAAFDEALEEGIGR